MPHIIMKSKIIVEASIVDIASVKSVLIRFSAQKKKQIFHISSTIHNTGTIHLQHQLQLIESEKTINTREKGVQKNDYEVNYFNYPLK